MRRPLEIDVRYNKNCVECGERINKTHEDVWHIQKIMAETRGDKIAAHRVDKVRIAEGWGQFCGIKCRDARLDKSIRVAGEHVSLDDFYFLIGNVSDSLDLLYAVLKRFHLRWYSNVVPHFFDIEGSDLLAVTELRVDESIHDLMDRMEGFASLSKNFAQRSSKSMS